MGWILPDGFSTFAGDIDFLYYVVLVLTGIAFVIVEVGLVVFMIKYRHRPGRKAEYIEGSNKAEVIWTAIPAVSVVVLGLMSGPTWNRIKGRDSAPPNSIQYGMLGSQFEWNVTYAGPDGQLGTGDDFVVRNQLHMPVNQPVLLQLSAEDVIHSFFIPVFRVKQDAVPGMTIPVWFEATQTGQWEIACAELCGLGHYRMRAMVTVHTQEDYQRWLAEQTAD